MLLSKFALLLETDKKSQIKKANQEKINSSKKQEIKKINPVIFIQDKQFISDLEHIQKNESKFYEQVSDEINKIINSKRPPMGHKVTYGYRGKNTTMFDTHLFSPTSDWILIWFEIDKNKYILFRIGRHSYLQFASGKKTGC